jgi:hypothetical protein
MLAFWSHLVARKDGVQGTIDLILGGHKQGHRVLEKMWMLQATFFTMKWGFFIMSTGSQEECILRRSQQQEDEKQAPVRDSGKKRDSKKAVPQKSSTQPAGKNSTFKGDGRSGQFKKDINKDINSDKE